MTDFLSTIPESLSRYDGFGLYSSISVIGALRSSSSSRSAGSGLRPQYIIFYSYGIRVPWKQRVNHLGNHYFIQIYLSLIL